MKQVNKQVKTSLINLINAKIISEFNDMDLDGSMISVSFRDYKEVDNHVASTQTQPNGVFSSHLLAASK